MVFQFKNHPIGLPFQHNGLFTLEWESVKCKWLLIHYVNNEKKRWYKRTERPYRFRRWFFRKASGTFSNLANYKSPQIDVYIFAWYIAWPRKITIPIHVNRLLVESFQVKVKQEDPNLFNTDPSIISQSLKFDTSNGPSIMNKVNINQYEPTLTKMTPPVIPVID
jgi:hypothetical protein